MASREEIGEIKRVVTGFLEELRKAADGEKSHWHEYASPSYRLYGGFPMIPRFWAYEVGGVRKAAGTNPDVVREVRVRLQLIPSSAHRIRWVSGTIRCIKESAPYQPDPVDGTWGVVPTSWRMERSSATP